VTAARIDLRLMAESFEDHWIVNLPEASKGQGATPEPLFEFRDAISRSYAASQIQKANPE
jgi:hypothetical protein